MVKCNTQNVVICRFFAKTLQNYLFSMQYILTKYYTHAKLCLAPNKNSGGILYDFR